MSKWTRRSERRAYTCSATWLCQQPVRELNPYRENEGLASCLLEERAVLSVRRAATNPASVPIGARTCKARKRVGYNHLGLPMPNRRMLFKWHE